MEHTITLDCATYVVCRHFSTRPTTVQDLVRQQLEKKMEASNQNPPVDRSRRDGL